MNNINNNNEYITCAAIYFDDDKQHTFQPTNIRTGFVICGHRHHNIFSIAHLLAGTKTYEELKTKLGIISQVQGFMTSKDRFVDRAEASYLAIAAKQINDDQHNCLFSEDIY